MHGLICPPGFVADFYKHDSSTVLFYEHYYIHDGIRFLYENNTGSVGNLDLYNKVKSELRVAIPTYNRWKVGASDLNVDFYRDVEKSFNIALVLKKIGVSCLFFFTSAPHHIHTEIFSVASGVINISSVFLCFSVFDSSLIPVKQVGRINSKKVIQGHITDEPLGPELEDFFKRSRKELPPAINDIPSKLTKSFLYSTLFLCYRKLRNSNVNFLNELSLIFNQRRYLSLYRKVAKSNVTISSNDIVIAAHFQPEATSFPEGLPYGNHLEIISVLRASGFKGRIFYKEHPASQMFNVRVVGLSKVGLYRNQSYIDSLMESNVTILPFDFKLNEENMNGAYALTMTGSIALERSDKKLNTIICGTPWFGIPPYCISLEDFICNKNVVQGETIEYLSRLISHNYFKNNVGIGHPKDMQDNNETEFINNFHRLRDIINVEEEV